MEIEKRYYAQPNKLPAPTYWPFFLAFGIVFIFWGIITNWFLTGMGLIIFIVALMGWITEIYRELIKTKEQ